MTYKWSDYAENIMAEFSQLIQERNQAIFDHAYEKVEAYISLVEAENYRMRAELDAERERNRWIPCSERLPEEENDYLVADKWGYVFEADYEKALSGFVYINPAGDRLADKTVTHWREMPAPPETK